MKVPKAIRRVLIILLLIVVLAEVAFLLINWHNMINVYTVGSFTINSTTGFLLLTLVTHNAYAKVVITIENPSNEVLLIHLSNGTIITLGPSSTIKLIYLFTPSSYYAYPVCAEGFGLGAPNASTILVSFLLNSMVNPIVIYENVTSLELLRQITPALLMQIKQNCAASGTYLLITTASSNAGDVTVMVIVSKLVIVI
ncbi:hypothetical protein [Vulcanisaeta sp. JCM 14467]|uniref:hypothetical protein n=1 Tax=Vulcanisaeta sp. JCM 14467 TaxID=1295370 RepID=UPI0006D08D7B|nr:hypothetical protein [Vulcanisaeta sp. JCM 14467]